MKNLKVITCICLALLIFNSNMVFAATGVVNTPAVRIREKASTDSEVLTKAYEDEEIEIISEEGEWYKVKVNGKTGYASKALISKKEESKNEIKNEVNTNSVSNYETETNTENINSKTTIKDDVVGRILPNFGSNEAILIIKGTEIEVLKELNNWNEVLVNGMKVWILKNKINFANETPIVSTDDIKSEENTIITDTNTIVEDNKTTEDEIINNETQNNTTIETNNTVATPEVRHNKGVINVETANIRKKADKSSSIIYHLDEGDEVNIVAEEGDWYKITNSEVESGYVSKTLVTISDISSRSNQEVREESISNEEKSSSGEEVANFAKQYIGCKYVLGGKTPENGFDCSGYTRYVFKNFGYSLGTVAADQNSLGTEIARGDLKTGDLILFYNEEKTKIGHTGIYLGNNEFIHAANPDRGVVIDNLSTNSYYSTRFVTARRIVE